MVFYQRALRPTTSFGLCCLAIFLTAWPQMRAAVVAAGRGTTAPLTDHHDRVAAKSLSSHSSKINGSRVGLLAATRVVAAATPVNRGSRSKSKCPFSAAASANFFARSRRRSEHDDDHANDHCLPDAAVEMYKRDERRKSRDVSSTRILLTLPNKILNRLLSSTSTSACSTPALVFFFLLSQSLLVPQPGRGTTPNAIFLPGAAAEFQQEEILPETLPCDARSTYLTTAVPYTCRVKQYKRAVVPALWGHGLDFEFGKLSESDFDALRKQYAAPWVREHEVLKDFDEDKDNTEMETSSRKRDVEIENYAPTRAASCFPDDPTMDTEFDEKKTDYNLLDFLPVSMRALVDYNFAQEEEALPLDLPRPTEVPVYKNSILVPNCWTTVYEVLRNMRSRQSSCAGKGRGAWRRYASSVEGGAGTRDDRNDRKLPHRTDEKRKADDLPEVQHDRHIFNRQGFSLFHDVYSTDDLTAQKWIEEATFRVPEIVIEKAILSEQIQELQNQDSSHLVARALREEDLFYERTPQNLQDGKESSSKNSNYRFRFLGQDGARSTGSSTSTDGSGSKKKIRDVMNTSGAKNADEAYRPRFGDLLFIYNADKGFKRPVLVHAVFFIDSQIVFEKAGTGALNPYRLTDLATVAKEWAPTTQKGLYSWHVHRLKETNVSGAAPSGLTKEERGGQPEMFKSVEENQSPLEIRNVSLGASHDGNPHFTFPPFENRFSLSAVPADLRWPEFWRWPAELQDSLALGVGDNPRDPGEIDELTLLKGKRYSFCPPTSGGEEGNEESRQLGEQRERVDNVDSEGSLGNTWKNESSEVPLLFRHTKRQNSVSSSGTSTRWRPCNPRPIGRTVGDIAALDDVRSTAQKSGAPSVV
ncbi:unnamed protein product [Amoebophrya sp. A120]|nr:unnamed protein product [Amoebophrya sp. A120]|eukprot:GSA120T00022329001.1